MAKGGYKVTTGGKGGNPTSPNEDKMESAPV